MQNFFEFLLICYYLKSHLKSYYNVIRIVKGEYASKVKKYIEKNQIFQKHEFKYSEKTPNS